MHGWEHNGWGPQDEPAGAARPAPPLTRRRTLSEGAGRRAATDVRPDQRLGPAPRPRGEAQAIRLPVIRSYT